MPENIYSTGEIAKICGVSVRTVQYYDQRGILIPSQLSEGGRRMYTSSDVKKLKLLTYLRSLGLSIDSIARIQKEENASKVISEILTQQIRDTQEEIQSKQHQVEDAKAFLEEIRRAPEISTETIQGIAARMNRKEAYRKVIRKMIIFGIIMGLIEYGTLIYALSTHHWLPFIIGYGIVLVVSIFFVNYYFDRVSYVCPECHQIFRPKKMQAIFAAHTPHTRKLSCPCCGKKSYCVETAYMPEDLDAATAGTKGPAA